MNKPKIIKGGYLDIKGWYNHAKLVYDINGIAPCIHAQSNNLVNKIVIWNTDSYNTQEE